MRTVKIIVASFPEEKPDGAIGIRRLGGKRVEERDETRVERVCSFNKRSNEKTKDTNTCLIIFLFSVH